MAGKVRISIRPPGSLVGSAIVTNQSQFFGYEFNGLMKILQNDHFRIDGILGSATSICMSRRNLTISFTR